MVRVGNTQTLFGQWKEAIAGRQLPVVHVARTANRPRDEMGCLFIGGSTEYKLDRTAEVRTQQDGCMFRKTVRPQTSPR